MQPIRITINWVQDYISRDSYNEVHAIVIKEMVTCIIYFEYSTYLWDRKNVYLDRITLRDCEASDLKMFDPKQHYNAASEVIPQI